MAAVSSARVLSKIVKLKIAKAAALAVGWGVVRIETEGSREILNGQTVIVPGDVQFAAVEPGAVPGRADRGGSPP